MATIVLSTLNAQYIHSSLGLRYLLANLGDLQADATIMEFIIEQRPIDIVEKILQQQPRIVGFGVYIWNVAVTEQVVALLKAIKPEITIIVGGPEVSYEHEELAIVRHADYLINGAADLAFAALCRQLLENDKPIGKVIPAGLPAIQQLQLPYRFYTDEDVAGRLIYVEASRGCPFKCEFCLSALDKTAYPFELDAFLDEMATLYQRGARHFKFVDRTFNLSVKTSKRILEFFLQRLDENLFLHFEIIPDHLPDTLKELIVKFPQGSLQFEIGIQTFNPRTQELISRKQNNEKSAANLAWIRQHSNAHIHADLIVGLPGETIESFAAGFDRLVALDPHEIQVGILKRLRGTPITRHTAAFGMKYNPHPPYNILCNNDIDFLTMQRLNRYARYWDMIANSGRFQHTKPLILGDAPFVRFMQLSDWIFNATGQTHRIALERLFDLLYQALTQELGMEVDFCLQALMQDFQQTGIKGIPKFLRQATLPSKEKKQNNTRRQERHARA